MKTDNKWQRVSKQRLCPICNKPDWCLFTGDPGRPTAAICARTESHKRCGEAGWLHVLRDDSPAWSPTRRLIHLATHGLVEGQQINFTKMAEACQQAVSPESLFWLGNILGLSVDSLERLGVGWSEQHQGWTFPMYDSGGKVVGIRLRLQDGRKLSVRGGRDGLFIPKGLEVGAPLYVCEGPTDCAALLDLSFNAVGRPSCTGGVTKVRDLVRQLSAKDVILVADSDVPGRQGAECLAAALVAYAAAVRVITPPVGVKDARQWKHQGATAEAIQAAVNAAPVRRLQITSRGGTKR